MQEEGDILVQKEEDKMSEENIQNHQPLIELYEQRAADQPEDDIEDS